MDEVADARAVGRRIVGAEQGEGRAEAKRGIGRQRQQMGLRIVRLADRPAGVRAGGVEVAQGRRAQAATGGLGERLLDPGLRLGVGADRRDRMGLGQQVGLRQPIHGAGTREDESLDVMPQRRVDQGVRLGHVVVEVALGLPDRFADFYVAREVDHRPRPVAREHLVEPRLVADVAALQRPPLHRPVVAFLQRVVADRPVASLGQRLADVAADIAGAAGDQDCDHPKSRRNGAG